VGHAGVVEIGIGMDAFAQEAREDGGGGGAVEASIVEANANFQGLASAR
jgi:hypothetical protein